MEKYKNIKHLVVTEVKKLDGKFPTKEFLAKLVKENFPNSKWKDTHYSWYKSQIKTGKLIIDLNKNDSTVEQIEETNDDNKFSISLEKDLQSYLSLNLGEIEKGLELVDGGIEYQTSAGFIDLLAKDNDGHFVVIELKAGIGKDAVIGQTLGYMGALSKEIGTHKIRGIIVASDFQERLVYAVEQVDNLKLVRYALNFSFTNL